LALSSGPSAQSEGQAEENDEATAPRSASPSDPRPLDYPKWETVRPGEHSSYNQRASLIQRGHQVYLKYCVGCHGVRGDGNGPAAVRLQTQPRDFTSGIYKFRSTDSSSLPTEADLKRTISRGLSRVSMPAFPLIPEQEKIAVIEYIKSFYPRWDEEKDQRRIVAVPRAPGDLHDSRRIARGRVVYLEMQCNQCHGIDGQGTGATQTEYVDAWSNKQRPFNFTRGWLKGGNNPEDIYRTFHTGLRSIMPAYEGETLGTITVESFREHEDRIPADELDALNGVIVDFPETPDLLYGEMNERDRLDLAERNSWDLVAYIISLRRPTTTAEAVLGPQGRDGR
jgi:cytochrome c oxidase cbb3-type subunit 2